MGYASQSVKTKVIAFSEGMLRLSRTSQPYINWTRKKRQQTLVYVYWTKIYNDLHLHCYIFISTTLLYTHIYKTPIYTLYLEIHRCSVWPGIRSGSWAKYGSISSGVLGINPHTGQKNI